LPRSYNNIEILSTPTAGNHAARIADVRKIMGEFFKAPADYAIIGDPIADGDASRVLAGGKMEIHAPQSSKSSFIAKIDIDPAEISLLAQGQRFLAAEMQAASQNGIYELASSMSSDPIVFKRAADMDSNSDLASGFKIHVMKGVLRKDKTYAFTTDIFGDEIDDPSNPTEIRFALDEAQSSPRTDLYHHAVLTADDAANEYTVAHNLGTQYVSLRLSKDFDGSGQENFCTDWKIIDSNSVLIHFDYPPKSVPDPDIHVWIAAIKP
jgi:hypothetical protein